jgi:hypothetical protein
VKILSINSVINPKGVNEMRKTIAVIFFLSTLIISSTICFSQDAEKVQESPKLQIDKESGSVLYKEIIELDATYNSQKLFNLSKEWATTNSKLFNAANSEDQSNVTSIFFGTKKANPAVVDQLFKNDQPLKFQDDVAKRLVVKGVNKYTGSTYKCLKIIYLEFDVKIAVKDAKAKIEITNVAYTHYNQASMKQMQIYGWSDEGNCQSKGLIEGLLKCDHCEGDLNDLYSYIDKEMKTVINSYKSFLVKNKNVYDNW